MSTIHFHETTTATPEQFVAGLTDFGPGRSELFPNSADSDLEVHSRGATRGGRHRGLGRHLGAAALRLVRPEPRRRQDDRLEYLGRQLQPHLRPQAKSRRDDRHRLRRGPRRQEPQGTVSRGRARKRRQGPLGERVRQRRQGHRGAQQRGGPRNDAHARLDHSRRWRERARHARDGRVRSIGATATAAATPAFPAGSPPMV